jgi:hypothetical protein
MFDLKYKISSIFSHFLHMARTKAGAKFRLGKHVVCSTVVGTPDGTFVSSVKGTVVKANAGRVTVAFATAGCGSSAAFECGADGCWRDPRSGAVLHLYDPSQVYPFEN